MNNINFLKDKKVLIGIAVVAVVLVIVWVSGSSKQGSENTQQQTTGQNAAQQEVQTVNGKAVSPASKQKTAAPAVPKIGMSMVSPANGEVWSVGKVHSIRWTHEGGGTGAISLIDAASKAVVGLITPNLSSQQVTYDWDTSWVAVSRTDSSRKAVNPGVYVIRVSFDSSNLKIESAPFQITASGADKILNKEVFIRNGLFIPNYIEVQKGDHVVMINDDGNNSRTVKGAGVNIVKLAPRDSYVFPITQSGTFTFGLVENAIAKLSISAN